MLTLGSFLTELCAVASMSVVTYCVDLANIETFIVTIVATLIEICIAAGEMIFVTDANEEEPFNDEKHRENLE